MPLVPYSLDRYRRLLYAVTGRLGFSDIGWSPHGPRAGFATEMRALRVPKAEIMEEGRWHSEQSFRIYVDVVGASDIHVALRTKGFLHAMAWAQNHWLSYLSPELMRIDAFLRGPSIPARK